MSKRELEQIVENGSVTDKTRLVDTLGALYLAQDRNSSARERDLFFDIVRHVIHDVEMQVRGKLAAQLADKSDAPHDLIVMLANDVIEVAFPVLTNSPVLRDEDLVRLVLEKTTEYRGAIAGRAALHLSVSQTIVSTGDVSAISTLLRNEGADIDADTLGALVDASVVETEFQELLISRHDLPEALANRLYDQVSDALREYISEVFPGVGDGLDIAVSDAVERALEEDRHSGPPDFTALDWSESQLPAALVHALETEDILRFEDLFQKLTGLGASAVARALYDLGAEGLAIACKAVDLDRDTFGKIFCHLRGKRPFAAFRDTTEFADGMYFFDGTKRENARRILEEWRTGENPAAS
jgi:uncharacterized protein (DUF2336 family)